MSGKRSKMGGTWVVVMYHPTLEPSTYGVFDNEEEAIEAAEHLQARWDDNAPPTQETTFLAFVNIVRSMGQPWDNR